MGSQEPRQRNKENMAPTGDYSTYVTSDTKIAISPTVSHCLAPYALCFGTLYTSMGLTPFKTMLYKG